MQPAKVLRRLTSPLAVFALFAFGASTAAHAWTETVLHSFAGGSDGAYPVGNVIADQSGNLYGTTELGGGACRNNSGCGTVFKVAPDGTETVLYAFHRLGDGGFPFGGLVEDSQGNLYGTTRNGGKHHCGTVFEITQNGVETVLYAFQCGSDGGNPLAGLVSDQAGNLYGTTSSYGDCSYCGTVFEVTPAGVYTLLHTFEGGSDGADSQSPLIFDAAANLYGATALGGGGAGCSGPGCGIVFELAPDGTEAVLHAFQGGRDGWSPTGALIRNAAGNLYGTTAVGGGTGCEGNGCGTTFEIQAGETETVLSRFNRAGGPIGPYGGMVMDDQGNLFGTSAGGGSFGCGTVFKIAPGHQAKAVYSFSCGSDGGNPVAGLLRDANGVLYGTTERGGKSKNGTVFAVQK